MNFRYTATQRLARWLAGLVSPELLQALRNKLKAEHKAELAPMIADATQRQLAFVNAASAFKQRVNEECVKAVDKDNKSALVERLSNEWRLLVRQAAGLPDEVPQAPSLTDLLQEFGFLRANQELLSPVFEALAHKRVLFAGQAYYNSWNLSRALRNLGWKADVLNWDSSPNSQIYYHGQDIAFESSSPTLSEQMLEFYLSSVYSYDVFHFSNAHGISFGWPVQVVIENYFEKNAEIYLLKKIGKKIVYSNNGCLDGISQTTFSKWGPESVCSICRWRDEPSVCSDERNLAWGKFRNSVADYQCTLFGNRDDYNNDPRVHETPEFYCIDATSWNPNLEIPAAYQIPAARVGTVRLYHAVGHKADRTTEDGINIKSSHIYLPLIEKLKRQGLLVELMTPTDIPNLEIRFLQVQADIFLDMLTFGWFGANAREAMMLGKPVICYIRPEWLENVRKEIPDYAAELPIVSATPNTVEAVLRDLVANPERRREIGRRSREFAVKWHSMEAGGKRFDQIYSALLRGDSLLRSQTNND